MSVLLMKTVVVDVREMFKTAQDDLHGLNSIAVMPPVCVYIVYTSKLLYWSSELQVWWAGGM